MQQGAKNLSLTSTCFLSFAAHGVLQDIVREYNSRVFQGPPGPPGPPGPAGYSRWFGSHGNATDLLEYIKCEQLHYDVANHKFYSKSKLVEVLVDTVPHLVSSSSRSATQHRTEPQWTRRHRTCGTTWPSRSPRIQPVVWFPRKRHWYSGIHQK